MTTPVEGPVRVRFAPSPTGFLHVGGARTAIYNELLRKSLGGAFVLRIEDTDKARSDEAMTRQIQEALAWLGVEWDEGPHLQSERLARHRERAEELLAEGKAYRCFCTPEALEEGRREAQARKETFRYPRTCLGLTAGAERDHLERGTPFVVRFRLPEGRVRFTDLVRGEVDFPQDALDDFILLRSDGSPTYHMSVVVDDLDMGITHILRGEDHLSNTPKHVPLFAALGGPVPVFAHLPLILGPDKKRLSKRVGSTSVEEFRGEGLLPEALYNYLALLGWYPGEEKEILSKAEMVERFSFAGLHASAAVFDPEKLAWVNAQYMSGLPLDRVLADAAPFLAEAGLAGAEPERLRAAVDLHRTRAHTLREMTEQIAPYFAETIDYPPEGVARFIGDADLPGRLDALAARYADLERFAIEPLEEALRGLATELEVKAGYLIHPTRMALSGDKAGPPLFDLIAAMGRERTLRHLARFAEHLRRAVAQSPAPGAPESPASSG